MSVLRVLKLFRLTVPPVGAMAVCYVGLNEHVFGLSYVVGKRLKPRLRRLLRASYLFATALTAVGLGAWLLTTCGTPGACPPVRLGERSCLAAASSGALWAVVMLPLERCASPLLGLGHPTGVAHRGCNAAAVVVLWFCMAHEQMAALLLLLLLAARRALASCQWASRVAGYLLKLTTALHMSRVLARRCEDGTPKFVVAAFLAMVPL